MSIKKDRRSSSRLQLSRSAKLDFETEIYGDCLIQDLSITGMFVHGHFQRTAGDKCSVTLVQKGKHTSQSLELSGQVVRRDDKGIAIVFTSMPLESLMLLQMILQCEDGAKFLTRGIESFDNLPFEVHDDLLR